MRSSKKSSRRSSSASNGSAGGPADIEALDWSDDDDDEDLNSNTGGAAAPQRESYKYSGRLFDAKQLKKARLMHRCTSRQTLCSE